MPLPSLVKSETRRKRKSSVRARRGSVTCCCVASRKHTSSINGNISCTALFYPTFQQAVRPKKFGIAQPLFGQAVRDREAIPRFATPTLQSGVQHLSHDVLARKINAAVAAPDFGRELARVIDLSENADVHALVRAIGVSELQRSGRCVSPFGHIYRQRSQSLGGAITLGRNPGGPN
jgi:hypothetical protein